MYILKAKIVRKAICIRLKPCIKSINSYNNTIQIQKILISYFYKSIFPKGFGRYT